MTLSSHSAIWKTLCLDSLERANSSPTLNYSAFPWKCRASNPVFSWKSSSNISLQEFHLTMTFSFNVFDPPSAFHERSKGAGTHETDAVMLKAADALWDAQSGHNPTVTAASTQRSRSPAPNSRKRGDKRSGDAGSKSRAPSHSDFYSFQNPGNGGCEFHNYYTHKAHRCTLPCAW
jgi:hypothetical protein